ncbi:MAG: hypothetical protein IT280_01215 [Ignavibacteria bacterium]|nr:hypothetical protein [Ignavibacteria bacterium]
MAHFKVIVKNMTCLNRQKLLSFIVLFTIISVNNVLFAQNQDSLLEKVKELDISLDAPQAEDEDLYLNTVSFQSFYDVLSPMGEWIQITKEDADEDMNNGEGEGNFLAKSDDEFIFIWKPEVTEGWKPYSNGRWEYCEQGWFWVSSDKWGNTTYNYGRWWHSPKFGWVWLPGYTWAPAWVRWRMTNDGKHVGWVALSPKAKWKNETGITDKTYHYKNNDADWVFVDNNTFAGEISSITLKSSNNSDLIKNSSLITEIKTENDRVFTGGPDAMEMEKRTGKKYNSKRLKFKEGKENAVVSDNEIIAGKEKFKREQKDKLVKPKKFRKSERVKKILKHRKHKIPRK